VCDHRSKVLLLLSAVLAVGCAVDQTGVGAAEPDPPKAVRTAGDATDGRTHAVVGGGVDAAGLDGGPEAGREARDAVPAADTFEPGGRSGGALSADAASVPPTRSERPPLLLALAFDDPAGSVTARDRSSLQQQVALVRLNTARCWVDGRRGGALAFGRDGYLAVALRGPLVGVTRFSFAAWLRRERADDDGVLISRGVVGAGGYAYRVWISGDRLRVQLNDPGPLVGFHQTGRSTLPVQRWVHVAVTFDGRRVRLYHDGALSDEWSYDRPLATSGPERPLLIGASESPGDVEGVRDRLTGRLDDVVVYGDPLDPAQVAALAASQE
jgi:Concanavalin A-like lectin/glucanases superfamily